MKIASRQIFDKLSRINYNDDSYYYGQEYDFVRDGYGKYCNKDTSIIIAGYWQHDECVEILSEEDIENILKDLY
ncbi:MAG TPA: hypothetical protein P5564_00700 [Paludibacteraceae bacterium]|nr:hypothetical protein [Paludibacteraceae bacterium]